MSGQPTTGDVTRWAAEVASVADRIGRHLARSEPRRRAVGYIRGLLSDAERKKGWQLAEALGDATLDGVQHLLARAGLDADSVRDDLMGYVAEYLEPPIVTTAVAWDIPDAGFDTVVGIAFITSLGSWCAGTTLI